MPSPNPYETPRFTAPELPLPADDGRTLSATFRVNRKLLERAVYSEVERRAWFRRTIFVASMLTMAALIVLLVFRQPYYGALILVLVFVLLHLLHIFLPYWWTRKAVREYERHGKWPLTFGENHVQLSADTLQVSAGDATRHWRLEAIADAFYLGDSLLICPEPGVMVPIPRTADFGSDSFQTFCCTFVIRMRSQRE